MSSRKTSSYSSYYVVKVPVTPLGECKMAITQKLVIQHVDDYTFFRTVLCKQLTMPITCSFGITS